jgi:uncharacterized protein (DUF2147 family)
MKPLWKKYILLMSSVLALSAVFAQQSPNAIVGRWKGEEEGKPLQMEIYLAADGKYYGKVVNDDNKKSKNGAIVVKQLSYIPKSNTYKGSMQPPEAAMTFNITLSLENNDRIRIVARRFLISKTMYLSRIN